MKRSKKYKQTPLNDKFVMQLPYERVNVFDPVSKLQLKFDKIFNLILKYNIMFTST